MLSLPAAPEAIRRKARGGQGSESPAWRFLRYGAGAGSGLGVLRASEQLVRSESRYVEALFNYHLALLTFETAKVAPVSGLSTGTSTGRRLLDLEPVGRGTAAGG